MEEKFEGFFKIIFDSEPIFNYEYLDIFDDINTRVGFTYIFRYHSFTNPEKFRLQLIKDKTALLLDLKLKLSKQETNKGYIFTLIDEFKKIKDDFGVYPFNGTEYPIHKNTIIFDISVAPIVAKITIEKLNEIDNNYRRDILDFNKYRYQIIETLIQELESLVDSFPDNPMIIEKLKINLSIPELALFFKLLIDEGLFEAKKTQALARIISQSFETKESKNNSPKQISNNFYEGHPDKVYEEIKGIVLRLSQHLNDHIEKYSR